MTDPAPTTEAPPAAEKEEQPPARLPEAELRQLALDVADGKVYTDRHGEDAIESFRMLFALMSGRPKHLEQWGMVYEYLDKAGSRAINGRPSFFSCKILHVDDVPLFLDFYRQARDLRAAFVAGAKPG